MSRRFTFNRDSLKIDVHRISVGRVLWLIFKYIFISAVIAALYYLIFALIFDTPKDEALKADNRLMTEEISQLEKRLDLLDKAVASLEQRDADLYRDIFGTEPPRYAFNPADSALYNLSDLYSMSESDIVMSTLVNCSRMDAIAANVTSQLNDITAMLDSGKVDVASIPSIAPLANFSVTQTGASVGSKFNPFFKTIRPHTGIDLMAPVGAEVVATADGKVIKVEKKERGFGNRVIISHESGLRTVYAHLSEVKVHEGQTVRKGQTIGLAGASGRAFAPHLHYEVLSGETPLEPVHYFFSVLNARTYRDMLILARTTGQSMD